jgi:hypothetical protein
MVDWLLKGACRGVTDWFPQKLGGNESGWAYAAVELYRT